MLLDAVCAAGEAQLITLLAVYDMLSVADQVTYADLVKHGDLDSLAAAQDS